MAQLLSLRLPPDLSYIAVVGPDAGNPPCRVADRHNYTIANVTNLFIGGGSPVSLYTQLFQVLSPSQNHTIGS
jgi:hypothetical protein